MQEDHFQAIPGDCFAWDVHRLWAKHLGTTKCFVLTVGLLNLCLWAMC